VRLGLLGCGGRGTWVAASFVQNTAARVTALADLFPDKLESARPKFPDASPGQLFHGPEAYRQIAASDAVDAIVVATPPYYHPLHLEAVVEAGKHVYLEKPVAVDVPGVRRVLRAGEKARGRLSLNVGFQIRRAPPYVELVRRIHAGALGPVSFAQAHFYGLTLNWPQYPKVRGDELRLRRWTHQRVLSGDILVEQGIHLVDVCNWALRAHPLKACGSGGRKVRTDEGDSWDRYAVAYQYPDNITVNFSSTQFDKGWWDACTRFFGARGVGEAHYQGDVRIYGDEPWTADLGRPEAGDAALGSALRFADSEKQKSFIDSIAGGQYQNEAAQGAESTLSAILGRTAAYTGREVSWEEVQQSEEVWDAGIDLGKVV
jgi:predicted dehydrogenase